MIGATNARHALGHITATVKPFLALGIVIATLGANAELTADLTVIAVAVILASSKLRLNIGNQSCFVTNKYPNCFPWVQHLNSRPSQITSTGGFKVKHIELIEDKLCWRARGNPFICNPPKTSAAVVTRMRVSPASEATMEK